MWVLGVCVFLLSSAQNGVGRTALEHFLEHRNLCSSSVTILNDTTRSRIVWIEQKFQTCAEGTRKNLKVGFFEGSRWLFDCKRFNVDVLDLLSEKLKIKLGYESLENNTFDDVDLVVCPSEEHDDPRFNKSSYYPLFKSEYILLYKADRLHLTQDIFVITFSGTLWSCFLVLLVLLAVSLHATIKYHKSSEDLWSWVDITLWANAAACQQGLSNSPRSASSRTIFFLGYLTSYLLYTGFAAGITSLLLQQTHVKNLGLDDVAKLKLKVVTMSHGYEVGRTWPTRSQNSSRAPDLASFLEQLDQDKTVGLAPKIMVDQLDLSADYSRTPLSTIVYHHHLVLLKNDDFKDMLRQGLQALGEPGLLRRALRSRLDGVPKPEASSMYSSAELRHVGSAIVLLVVGAMCALILLVAELLVALYRTRILRRRSTRFYNSSSF